MNEEVKNNLNEMKESLKTKLNDIKVRANKDLEIDEIDLDKAVLKTPSLHNYYNALFTDASIALREMYSYKEKVKLERWKYYNNKQTDRYYAKHGILHEKILKTDIDKYLSADEMLILVNDIVTIQKAICDFLERTIKEVQTRNFHIKAAIDWRRFVSGG